MTKKPTMITDWLDEHGDPEITRKVEKEAELREAARKYAEPYRCPATNENEYCRHDIISAFNNGAKWQVEQQNQFAIKFGVWLSTNCLQDTSKDGWWQYQNTLLTTDECLTEFKYELINGNA